MGTVTENDAGRDDDAGEPVKKESCPGSFLQVYLIGVGAHLVRDHCRINAVADKIRSYVLLGEL
jgi:hypothetical protein